VHAKRTKVCVEYNCIAIQNLEDKWHNRRHSTKPVQTRPAVTEVYAF